MMCFERHDLHRGSHRLIERSSGVARGWRPFIALYCALVTASACATSGGSSPPASTELPAVPVSGAAERLARIEALEAAALPEQAAELCPSPDESTLVLGLSEPAPLASAQLHLVCLRVVSRANSGLALQHAAVALSLFAASDGRGKDAAAGRSGASKAAKALQFGLSVSDSEVKRAVLGRLAQAVQALAPRRPNEATAIAAQASWYALEVAMEPEVATQLTRLWLELAPDSADAACAAASAAVAEGRSQVGAEQALTLCQQRVATELPREQLGPLMLGLLAAIRWRDPKGVAAFADHIEELAGLDSASEPLPWAFDGIAHALSSEAPQDWQAVEPLVVAVTTLGGEARSAALRDARPALQAWLLATSGGLP
jgi:hypothetical protein